MQNRKREPVTPAKKVQRIVTLTQSEMNAFCGPQDRSLKKIQSRLRARITARGNEIRITGTGAEVETAFAMINELVGMQRAGAPAATERQLHHALAEEAAEPAEPGAPTAIKTLLGDALALPTPRIRLTPLTKTQKTYMDLIRERDIVFGIGPAGTGKTYLAMAMAVWSLMQGRVGRIILVRPVVEAGEHLGFLPGDIAQKFDPYVRPLYDALYEMMEADKIREFMENGTIEIAPLAYMRGRTLNNSFVILDEAQNTSVEQMKMFLTRMGFQSKSVITGDVTQVDLPRAKMSGLVHVQEILSDIPEIGIVNFTRRDVVRHELVQKIIQAYESHGKK